MVYIHSWQEFQDAAESLYTKSPENTRYCVKWRSSEGKLVLKITDNTTCIKFKTYSSIFLNRFEALNLSLMRKMQNKKAAPVPVPAAAQPLGVPSAESAQARATPAPGAQSTVTPTPSGPASGGVKKKKKGKK